VSEFARFFDTFVEDFDSFDGTVIAARYTAPYLAVAADGSSRLFADPSSISRYFHGVL
jgi:hypothetical protein